VKIGDTDHGAATSGALVALWATLLLLAACCNACGGKTSCKATVKYTGSGPSADKPFVGKGGGSTKKKARTNACWDYCFQADPKFDAQYRNWLDGDDGRAYQQQAKEQDKKISKKRIIIDDATTLEKPFAKCVKSCLKNASAKKKDLRFGKASCSAG
jgi:hypothetical protein